MSQDLGPIPCDLEDLQWWPNGFAFLSIVKYQYVILLKIWGPTFSRNWRYIKLWDQFHVIRRVSKGGLTHLLFFISSNISLEFYAKFEGQRFLETGDVSRPGTNSMWLGGSRRVAWRIFFSFHRKMSFWNFMQKFRVNVSRNWRCLKT